MNNFSFYRGGRAYYCLIFVWLCMSFSSLFAKSSYRQTNLFPQQHQIQGTVTDGTNPLPGVTISIKSKKNNAVISDYSGQFSISCSPHDTLVVSYISFKTVMVPIKGRKLVDVQLIYDSTTLQEVRINAGYYSVKDKEKTGSIARITAKDIEKQPVSNVLAAMQGRMAGVSITQTTGSPGGGFDIQIRGRNSLRSSANNPLYIIDGVPYASDPIGVTATSAVLYGGTSPLSGLNPNQIESIEVLKDADATSIYGSRGANGVVLITTKKGSMGDTKYSAKYSRGFGSIAHFANLMKTPEYLKMREQAFKNDGYQSFPTEAFDVNGIWDKNRYTDWQETLLGGIADFIDAQASVSGGSNTTKFFIGAGYNKETTVLPAEFAYQKRNLRVNLNHRSPNQKFTLDFTAGYTAQGNNLPSLDFTSQARMLAPNAPALYTETGDLNWENSTFSNPLAALEGKYRGQTYDMVSNAVLGYRIKPNLQIRANLGYTALNHEESTTIPSTIYDPSYGVGSEFSILNITNTTRRSWIAEPQLNYKRDYGNLALDLLAGATYQNLDSGILTLRGTGFPSNSMIHNLGSATNVVVASNSETNYKYQAFFFRANINYDSKYILNFTGRRDGSSRFGANNRFATFGAIGAAWLFGKENWFKDSRTISFGKLRASYGTTGSDQIGDYQFLNTYTTTNVNYNGIIGLAPSRLYNPNFGWETNKKLEVAIELGFFNDRIFITGAWFRNLSSSQLVGIPLPGTTGFSSVQANLGAKVENKGIELTLRTINIRHSNFEWSTSLNMSFLDNTLIEFPNLQGSTYANQFVIGKSTNIRKMYKVKGVNPQTGIYEFLDYNNDGIITASDRQHVADFTPKYFGGLQNSLRYKNFQLDILFQFVKQSNYSFTVSSGPPGGMVNYPAELNNSWTQAGDNTSLQIFTTGINSAAIAAYDRFSSSDAAVVDASYIRLKNFSFSYKLPSDWLKSIECRLIAQGQNLLTFTKYKGNDPEFIGNGYLPPLRTVTTGIQLDF
ncbi:SusC/RagA family TonB-linked outer membrane protein [Flavobacterium anhuiense]|uniref:SusC/RagA family TonB-linked outer membrane protein n=1 Tax=Flavobacterium anhuiense TaxID=459526 RepID=UPI000E6D169A|nr:SusC/RagA family TonB-linked outer membrane protein [Flavobacterium anhuiense]